jgi:hypothetical protein
MMKKRGESGFRCQASGTTYMKLRLAGTANPPEADFKP